jgi:hypothetical protein
MWHADFPTLKTEAIRSSETMVHTKSKRRNIPEDGILHSPAVKTSNLAYQSIYLWAF